MEKVDDGVSVGLKGVLVIDIEAVTDDDGVVV